MTDNGTPKSFETVPLRSMSFRKLTQVFIVMEKININGVDYDYSSFTEDIKRHLNSYKFVQDKLKLIELEKAALQTAGNAYAEEINKSVGGLGPEGEIPMLDVNETIRVD